MKSTTDVHREALDQALRIALGTSQPALKRQALARAGSHLIHPRLLLESPLLTDSHPWRREALQVSDAFEAVTNGMHEPGVLEVLDDLSDDSPFQSWRHLILAIHFFYEGLDEAVKAHLSQIPTQDPVAPLVRTIESLVEARIDRLPWPLRRLAEQVAQADPELQAALQDLSEGLETGDEPLFWSSLADWLEHVAPIDGPRAQAAVLWAWNQLEWRDFDEAVLLDLSERLWGAAESYRLAALGSLPWDAEGASLLWLRFLLTAVRDGGSLATISEGRRLWNRFQDVAANSATATDEAVEILANLSWAWNAEIKARGWSHELAIQAPNASRPTASLVPRPTTDGQLDLFA